MSQRAMMVFLASAVAGCASGQLFQPDSAMASSEFNGSFDIGNTIDGSGLEMSFGKDSSHADYASNNHWTTQRDAMDVNAEFFFDVEVTIGQFLLWNHRSNIIADDPNYGVRTFDLTLMDAGNNELLSLTGLSAEQDVATAQTYSFAPVSGVRSVRIDITENYGSRLFGFAEVAFSAVPSPASGVVLGAAGVLGARRRR